MNIICKSAIYSCICLIILGNGSSAKILPFKINLPNLPNIPSLANLPTPLNFLTQLINATALEIIETASSFTFTKSLVGDEVRFLQYRGDGSFNGYTIHDDIPIDARGATKIVIHGWKSKGSEDWVRDIAVSYNQIGIGNILAVDWQSLADDNYIAAARGTKNVGDIVGKFIFYNILKADKTKLENIHIIGHSLGAQVSGFVGKKIRELAGGRLIRRITGLDAAAPFFEYPLILPDTLRLSSNDAEIVEGLHTNMGFLGFFTTFGRQDYYISNGGPIQPGCLQGVNYIDAFLCSHGRSHKVFRKTITSTNYVAYACESQIQAIANLCQNAPRVIMGEHNNGTSAGGTFYINVDGKGDPISGSTGGLLSILKNIMPKVA